MTISVYRGRFFGTTDGNQAGIGYQQIALRRGSVMSMTKQESKELVREVGLLIDKAHAGLDGAKEILAQCKDLLEAKMNATYSASYAQTNSNKLDVKSEAKADVKPANDAPDVQIDQQQSSSPRMGGSRNE